MENLGLIVVMAVLVIALAVPVVKISSPTVGSKATRARAAAVLGTLDPTVRREAAALGNVIAIDDGGREIVHRVTAHHKRMEQVAENRWHLGRREPDDLLVEWVPYSARGTGGILRVARSIGVLGRPAGHREWLRLLDTVEEVARGSSRFYSRRLGEPLVPSSDAMPGLVVWIPPGS